MKKKVRKKIKLAKWTQIFCTLKIFITSTNIKIFCFIKFQWKKQPFIDRFVIKNLKKKSKINVEKNYEVAHLC